LRPAEVNSLQDPISKITTAKWTGVVVQAVECLICKHEALSSNPHLTKKKIWAKDLNRHFIKKDTDLAGSS
jgi:hypothetical protein